MSGALDFDEEASRRVEAVYLTPDVVAQRAEVLRVLDLRPGERVLDIGSGPGLLAQEMARAVGSSGRVAGVDLSESMLAMAQQRCAEQPWVDFRAADATGLPFADGDFDVAVSTQVYEYVPDIAAALAELYRVLAPGGRAAVLDTDWASLVLHTADPARMARVLAAWDGHLADPYLPRTLAPRMRAAGFDAVRCQVIPLCNVQYGADTYSHGMIDLVADFVAGRRGVTEEEARAWADELRALGEAGEYFFSLNRYLFLAQKPG
jgi:ubiquinone/menaquinone biosynthesis C-methylase UbiE